MIKTSLKTKLIIIKDALKHIAKKPSYITIGILAAFFMAGLVIWSLNLGLIIYIFLDAPLNFIDKIGFFVDGYQSLFSNINSYLSVSIIVFSILFGVNIALLVYVLRHIGYSKIPKKSGGGAFIFAILSGGCIACGTSLLTPILISLGLFGGAFVRDLGTIFNVLGSVLLLYSIYKLSIAVHSAKTRAS